MAHRDLFTRFARRTSRDAGRPATFGVAVGIIVVWAVTGPLFHYSDSWQLVINTGTTIITFLMVFLIQNTQNRDSQAMQIKLDELIRAHQGAHNAIIELEELSDKQLEDFRKQYAELARIAREDLRRGRSDTNRPHVAPDSEDEPPGPRQKGRS